MHLGRSCLRQNIISLLVPTKIIMLDLNLAAHSEHLHYSLAIHTSFPSPRNCLHTFTKPWQAFDPNLDGFCWTGFPCLWVCGRMMPDLSQPFHLLPQMLMCDWWKSGTFFFFFFNIWNCWKWVQIKKGEIMCISNPSSQQGWRDRSPLVFICITFATFLGNSRFLTVLYVLIFCFLYYFLLRSKRLKQSSKSFEIMLHQQFAMNVSWTPPSKCLTLSFSLR